MTIAELFLAALLLALPFLLVLWLLVRWLRFPSPDRRWEARTVDTTITLEIAADVVTEAVESISTSIATQVGTIAHLTIEIAGYLVARLRGVSAPIMLLLHPADAAAHVVELGGVYELAIHSQVDAPQSYQGATVNRVVVPEPLQLSVLVEGEGLEVSDGGRSTLEIHPGYTIPKTLRVRPFQTGKTTLRIDFFHENTWAQTIDLVLEVDTTKGVEQIKRRASEEGNRNIKVAEVVEGSMSWRPPISYSEPRLHLNLAFAPSQGSRTYRGLASNGQAQQPWRPLDVPLHEHDLREVNEGLREALEFVRHYFGDRLALTKDEATASDYLELIDRLARRGNDAFKRLFPKPDDRNYLVHALAQADRANLEISTDAFFLPWELLYDGYDPKGIDIKNFWGFRYKISRLLTSVRQQQSPLLLIAGQPRIALFVNPDLPYAVQQEVPYFRHLDSEGKISLQEWCVSVDSKTDTSPPREQRSHFFEYCRSHESDVAHFACHAVVAEYSRDSYISLSRELPIHIEDMAVENCQFAGAPLVVLNACGTSIRDPSKTSDFVHSFMMSGCRGVIATECDVPDLFASMFIQDLYRRFLEGEPVVRAVFNVRHSFLMTHNNPLGLMYSAYLPFETRLIQNAGKSTVSGT